MADYDLCIGCPLMTSANWVPGTEVKCWYMIGAQYMFGAEEILEGWSGSWELPDAWAHA